MSTTKRICIIGAGAAGLCAGKRCLAAGYSIKIYEQYSELGGTWIYSEKTGTHSSMYEKMHTNLPKEVMRFEDFPFPEKGPSFIEHFTVLKYLKKYASEVKSHIQYKTKVIKVERSFDNSAWNVLTEVKGLQTTSQFDVVFVCNGHFSMPRIPAWADKLEIPAIHSHDYRKAKTYKGKVVAIIGAGPSGIDIGIQIGKYAKKVYICHQNYKTTKMQLPDSLKIVARATDATKNSLILSNGIILQDINSVIFCTGYRYHYPFFENYLIQTPENGSYVSPLFAHVAHVQYPESLYFIGLNTFVVPFILFDYQVSLALALMNGKATEIGEEKIQNWETEKLQAMKEKGIEARRFHVLADQQWDYFRELCKYSEAEYKTPEVIRLLYDVVSEGRKSEIMEVKKQNYKVIDSDTYEKLDASVGEVY